MSRKNEEIADTITSTKEHYKMYKAGKQWLFAGITVFTFGGLLAGGEQAAKADATSTNGSNTTDPQTDATKQTNAPLEFSTSVTQTNATASAAPTSVAPASVAASQSSVKTSTASSQTTNSQASTAPSSVASKTLTAQTSTAPASVTSQASEAQTSTASQAKDVQTSTAPASATSTAKDVQTSTAPASVAGATKDAQTSTSPASTTSQAKTDQASQSKDATTSPVTASTTSQTSDAAQTSTAPASATTNTSTVASQTSAASTAPTKQVTALPDNATSQQVADAKSAPLAAFAETGTPQEITRTDAAVTSDATTSAAAATSAATTSAATNQAWTDFSKVLAAAKAEVAGGYTSATYAALNTAIQNNNSLTSSSAKVALKAAQEQLQNAIDGLVNNLGGSGYNDLTNVIKVDQGTYPDTSSTQYTTKSWQKYLDALSAAQSAAADPNTTGSTFSVLYQRLNAATADLEANKSTVLFEQLTAQISSAADNINTPGAYTIASLRDLQAAQSAAQTQTAKSSAQDIQTALANLRAAQSALVPSGSLSGLQVALNTTAPTYTTYQTDSSTADNYAYGQYTHSSWDAFASAYVYAKAVMNNGAATPDQISTAMYNLKQGYQGLVGKQTVSEALSDAIAGGNQILQKSDSVTTDSDGKTTTKTVYTNAYSSDSTNNLIAAITAASTYLNSSNAVKNNATPDQLIAATDQIQKALSALVTTASAAQTDLNDLINTAGSMSAGDYNSDGYQAVLSAAANGKRALYDDSSAADFQTVAGNLRTAIWSSTPSDATVAKAKANLSAAVANALPETLNKNQYSPETYNLFASELTKAQKLLDSASLDSVAMQKVATDLAFYQSDLGGIVASSNTGGSLVNSAGTKLPVSGLTGGLLNGSGWDTVGLTNTGHKISVGGAASFGWGYNTNSSVTSVMTLPLSLVPFFKSADWQKYVSVAYYIHSSTWILNALRASTYGTGLSSNDDVDPSKTISLLNTKDAQGNAVPGALSKGDFNVRLTFDTEGRPVLTIITRSLGNSSGSQVQYYFELDIPTWASETKQYLARTTGDKTLDAVSFYSHINGALNGAIGDTSDKLENVFATNTNSALTPNTPQSDFSSDATTGTATLVVPATASTNAQTLVQLAVPQFSPDDLTSVIVQGTNTILGKVKLDHSTDAVGDIYQVVFKDQTTGKQAVADVNSDGTFVASFGNTIGTTTTGLNVNTGDLITGQIQRVNTITGLVSQGTIGYASQSVPAAQTPFVYVNSDDIKVGSSTISGTISSLIGATKASSEVANSPAMNKPSSNDLNVYTVSVTVYNPDGSVNAQTTTQVAKDGTWTTQVGTPLTAGKYVEATAHVSVGIISGSNAVQPTGVQLTNLNTNVSDPIYVEANKDALNAAIATADPVLQNQSAYPNTTGTQFSTLAAAQSDARKVSADKTATQTTVNETLKKLDAAMTAITLSKSGLEAAITAAPLASNASKYTPTSWSNLQTALDQAHAVDQDSAATADQITSATNALLDATSALQFVTAATTTNNAASDATSMAANANSDATLATSGATASKDAANAASLAAAAANDLAAKGSDASDNLLTAAVKATQAQELAAQAAANATRAANEAKAASLSASAAQSAATAANTTESKAIAQTATSAAQEATRNAAAAQAAAAEAANAAQAVQAGYLAAKANAATAAVSAAASTASAQTSAATSAIAAGNQSAASAALSAASAALSDAKTKASAADTATKAATSAASDVQAASSAAGAPANAQSNATAAGDAAAKAAANLKAANDSVTAASTGYDTANTAYTTMKPSTGGTTGSTGTTGTDANGNKVTTTLNSDGSTTAVTTDKDGKTLSTVKTNADGSSSTTTPNSDGSSTTVNKDKAGKVVTSATTTPNSDGSSTTVVTDAAGKTVSTTTTGSDGSTTTVIPNSDDSTTTTQRDPQGKLVSETKKNADGTSVTTTPNSDGSSTSVTKDSAEKVTSTTTTDPFGNTATTTTSTDGTSQTVFKDPSGKTLSTVTKDANGKVTSTVVPTTDGGTVTTTPTSDGGSVVVTKNASGDTLSTVTKDANGNVVSKETTDANGNKVTATTGSDVRRQQLLRIHPARRFQLLTKMPTEMLYPR